MPSVAVDSSVLCALFDPHDRRHSDATAFMSANRDVLVSNIAVLTEVSHLLAFSKRRQIQCMNFAADLIEVDLETASDLRRIIAIMQKYADLPADFADAALLALCERTGVDRIATFDKDFDVYRLANGRALTNVMST